MARKRRFSRHGSQDRVNDAFSDWKIAWEGQAGYPSAPDPELLADVTAKRFKLTDLEESELYHRIDLYFKALGQRGLSVES